MTASRARPGIRRVACRGIVIALAAAAGPLAAATESGDSIALPVPIVRQSAERCGPAALAMTMRYHGAEGAALAWADSAYDPVLRGALITRLADCARRAGFDARVNASSEDSLLALLGQGLPPIVLYDRGMGRIHRGHYGVVVGWESDRQRYTLHDGGAPRHMTRSDFARRWRSAGSLVLVVKPVTP